MPKETSTTNGRQHCRHNPLHEELLESNSNGTLRKVARTKRREKQNQTHGYIDSGISQRILQIAKEQQDEIELEEGREDDCGHGDNSSRMGVFLGGSGQMQIHNEPESDEGEYEDFELEEDYEKVEEIEVDEVDEELFNRFLPSGEHPEQQISLADKILEKIAQHEAKLAGHGTGAKDTPSLPPKVVEVYTK
jgi:essential nuclear protein 1